MVTPTQCHLWQKKKLDKDDLTFDTVKMLTESSHLDRGILKCKQCGQLYFYEFYEYVNFGISDDKMYNTYIPIKEKDIQELESNSPLELLSKLPRLQWDDDDKIHWVGK